jgi:cytochrome c oxidase assembly protein subunit 15
MMAMMVLQIVLGIVTVLYSAPWYFAIAHQFGALVLIVLILRARFLSMYPVRQSVRATA